jgi:protein required for attachment to host cells
MPKAWVVIAEQGCARFYTLEKPRGELDEVERLEHAEGSRRESELISDRPGRAFDSVGAGRHAMEPPVDAKEAEALRFAKEIADHLEKARAAGRFDRLVLVAGPQFLGLLRQKLSPALAQIVTQEIPKNLGQYEAREIRAHLPEIL